MADDWVDWARFAELEPQLAEFGAARLSGRVSYLATVRDRGLPRVHPIQAIVSARRLMTFMLPTSPKGHDLRRDGRYGLHTAVSDTDGTGGEFMVRGRAQPVDDREIRREAADAGFTPQDDYVLFELSVEQALANEYVDGQPSYRRWPR